MTILQTLRTGFLLGFSGYLGVYLAVWLVTRF